MEPKKWFHPTKSSDVYKAAVAFGFPNCPYKIRNKAKLALEIISADGSRAKVLDDTNPNGMWEVKLYKLIDSTKYKFIVKYASHLYCEIKVKFKQNTKTFELVDLKTNVKYPNEFLVGEDDFSSASVGAVHGTSDGSLKAMAAFATSNTLKRIDVKSMAKTTKNVPQKLASGHILFSVVSPTQTLPEYNSLNSENIIDTSQDLDYITDIWRREISQSFNKIAQMTSNVRKNMVDSKDIQPTEMQKELFVSPDNLLKVFTLCKRNHSTFEMTTSMQRRVYEIASLGLGNTINFQQKRNEISLEFFLGIINRVLNEQSQGHFHMTVKELHHLFSQYDINFDSLLEATEIKNILKTLNKSTQKEDLNLKDLRKYMLSQKNTQGNIIQTMSLENFISMSQALYKNRGGQVVANSANGCTFKETRKLLEFCRERIERQHLEICRLKSDILNLDEQIEVMDTIDSHSSLFRELANIRNSKDKLVILSDKMILQQRSWIEEISAIHSREISEAQKKLNFIEEQHQCYENDYSNALVEIDEVNDALNDVKTFTRDINVKTVQDASNIRRLNTTSKERLQKYKNGRKGTIFSSEIYNAGTASLEFLQAKTSALENWLVSRTKFTQNDREKYIQRIQLVKEKRTEYDKNKARLFKHLDTAKKKVLVLTESLENEIRSNKKLHQKVIKDSNFSNNIDSKEEEEIVKELASIQEAIQKAQMQKMNLSRNMYPKQHSLQLERQKISRLQIELCELKILIEEVHSNTDADAARRTTEM